MQWIEVSVLQKDGVCVFKFMKLWTKEMHLPENGTAGQQNSIVVRTCSY